MKRLLLAGGGHAHLFVLRQLAAARWPETEVTLVSPYPRQIYSGMLPGWIAGHYRLDECAVALAPLAAAAGVRFVQDHVIAVEAGHRRVRCATVGELPYDLLSVDTGAPVDPTALAATGARLLPIRPLEDFVTGWEASLAAFAAAGTARVAVVGGGAAGIELALAVRHRLTTLLGATQNTVFLVEGEGLLAGHGAAVVARAARALARHGVVRHRGRATGAPAGLRLADGSDLPVDCLIAAPKVAPPAWLADSGLALAADGHLAVGEGQRSPSHPEVFAAGDVSTRVDAPHAKSGVYAVRAGPVLAANLQRALAGLPPLPYRPQARSLYLLATGPKAAIVSWGGWTAGGSWAWHWKDWIDRRFLRPYTGLS
jgi:pyridine nucleotide-disulfide oxidoreductase family protein